MFNVLDKAVFQTRVLFAKANPAASCSQWFDASSHANGILIHFIIFAPFMSFGLQCSQVS